MKKIIHLMGRGIEGCGVTKFTIEFDNWLNNNGYDSQIIALTDKKWSRNKSHVFNVSEVKFKKDDEATVVLNRCNDADLVIIESLPSIAHDENAILNFKRVINSTTTDIMLIQHDHSALSIRRNACQEDAIDASKYIYAHALTNDFAKIVDEYTNTLWSDSKEVRTFQPAMDFDLVRAKYWKDIEEQDPLHHKWIGRTTSWKGYKEMFKFTELLKKEGYLVTMEGIERSPAFIDFKNLGEFHSHVAENIEDIDLKYGSDAYVFGPYINDDLLHRMSRVGFGYQLSRMKEKYIYRSIEYTHCEVVCTGTIPVFNAEYGRSVTHRSTDNRMINDKNTGTIWFDQHNMDESLALINKLASDNVMRNEWREMAFEYYKDHQDSNNVFKEIMNEVC